MRDHARGALQPFVVDELRLNGAYEQLAERARKKSDALGALEDNITGVPSGSGVLALQLWFFEERLGRALPDDVEEGARQLGFANAASLDAAVQRERSFLEIGRRAESA